MLAVLQHHGVHTRLIDVTSNPMTALWFATEEHKPDENGDVRTTAGVLFAVDVTDTDWYETFSHSETAPADSANPLAATLERALETSKSSKRMFRALPALPDDRMRAQEGFFLGSIVPARHRVPGVLGLNPAGQPPGEEKLKKLLTATEKGPGRPASLPFCAIVIPNRVKEQLRDPLKRTYNRRRRVLFPDVDGFREGLDRNQLD